LLRINKMIQQATREGYNDIDAQAKVCQDIVLKALAESSLSRNATIKGGVVMRSLSGDVRRATQDMDIDFIRYSLSDEAIQKFIEKINCLEEITIRQTGLIEELKQQDYRGKRVFVIIEDSSGDAIESKIDLGIHKNLSIMQEEYCFDIASFNDSANLLINSKEQMFTEKMRSLLKFGQYSTRYKDIFDLCFLSELVDRNKLLVCFDIFIFSDAGMKEKSIQDIIKRTTNTLNDKSYKTKLAFSKKNWLDISAEDATGKLCGFLKTLEL
jgi:predicted nucleotidyltransferase component of viral defense system